MDNNNANNNRHLKILLTRLPENIFNYYINKQTKNNQFQDSIQLEPTTDDSNGCVLNDLLEILPEYILQNLTSMDIMCLYSNILLKNLN